MNYTRNPEPHFDIPYINIGDIAFLLIIFFILTSTFMRESYIKVKPPASQDVKRVKDAEVSVSMDEKGQIWLQGTPCQLTSLESGITALLQDKKEKLVALKIDRGLQQSQFGPVMMAISNAGAEVMLVGGEGGK
jgi:biopolymer transport protein ExbD